MARKRHSDEDILKLLREIEVTLANGSDVASACRGVGISEATYYNWRKRFGGMGRSQLSEMRSLEKTRAFCVVDQFLGSAIPLQKIFNR